MSTSITLFSIFFLLLIVSFFTNINCKILHYIRTKSSSINNVYNDFIKDKTEFRGFEITYEWKNLEISKGIYDLSSIEDDLKFCDERGLDLWVQIICIRFCSPIDCGSTQNPATPSYMWTDSKYGGDSRYYGNYERRVVNLNQGGWYPLLVNQYVKEEYHKLLRVIGETFNGEINFMGVTLAETAGSMKEEYGVTPESYELALKQNLLELKSGFPDKIVHQNINFAQFDLEEFVIWLLNNDLSFGSPDVKCANYNLKTNVYPLHLKYHNYTEHGIDVQYSNYEEDKPGGGFYSPSEILDFIENFINPRYLAWAIRDPYFDPDVPNAIKDYNLRHINEPDHDSIYCFNASNCNNDDKNEKSNFTEWVENNWEWVVGVFGSFFFIIIVILIILIICCCIMISKKKKLVKGSGFVEITSSDEIVSPTSESGFEMDQIKK